MYIIYYQINFSFKERQTCWHHDWPRISPVCGAWWSPGQSCRCWVGGAPASGSQTQCRTGLSNVGLLASQGASRHFQPADWPLHSEWSRSEVWQWPVLMVCPSSVWLCTPLRGRHYHSRLIYGRLSSTATGGRGRNKLLHIGLAGNHCVFLVSVLAQKVFEWLITNIDNSFLGGVRKWFLS